MTRSPILTGSRSLAALLVSVLLPFFASTASAQANGKLQIHHIKVGQGDGMLLISPLGQTALFDDGVYTNCTEIKNYIQGLGITVVDYHFASHYHADHIGCIDDLAAIGITIGAFGYDRGSSYSSATYTNYANTLGTKRRTLSAGQVITLDAGAANPVLLQCVALNGAGVYSPSGSDENAKSVVMKVTYGAFDEVIGGDLTGDAAGGTDVETTVGPQVGDVEIYKVHHHGSRYSTNNNWLDATTPEVAIIQVGNGNTYGHPTLDALGRLHAHGVKTYWTETGAGAAPNATWDRVANGTIVVQADPGVSDSYTVSGPGFSETYANGGSPPPPPPVHATEYPSALTVLKGSLATGDVTRLSASDDSRIGVSAGASGNSFYTDWYGSAVLAHPPLNLTVTYEGSFTVSRTQTLSLWNWTTSAWDQIGSGNVGTSDVVKTHTPASFASYVSATREVRFRVTGNNRKSTYTSRGDLMAFDYDYAQGTAPATASQGEVDGASAPFAATAPATDERSVLPQSTLRRVEAKPSERGVLLTWAVAAGEHVDGFHVYRETDSGERVLLGVEAGLELMNGEALFHFVDEQAGGGAHRYWLGSRACSGSEGLIGPMSVEAPVRLAPIRLALGPNPARTGTSFTIGGPAGVPVRLQVFDVAGRLVATPFAGALGADGARIDWDLTGADRVTVRPGVYFARLEGAGQTAYARVIVAPR